MENKLHIKQEKNESSRNDLEAQIEKNFFDISNLQDEKNQLENKTENLEASIQEHKREIKDLKKSLQNSRCAATKLNEELNN